MNAMRLDAKAVREVFRHQNQPHTHWIRRKIAQAKKNLRARARCPGDPFGRNFWE